MTVPTTTYESAYPSAVYEGNLQRESRLDDPTTVADARAYNMHDVEIKRIQEILGPVTGGLAGGTFHERITTIETGSGGGGVAHDYVGPMHNGLGDNIPITNDGFGNTTLSGHASDVDIHFRGAHQMPFHTDALDDNYQFAKWFLDWMGIWDLVNADGLVSILELVKALWQNKYDVEIPLDPQFLYPTVAEDTGSGWVFKYTLGADLTIYCGEGTGARPFKPIGGACNLEGRPYPIYTVQNNADDSYFLGRRTLPSGTVLKLATDPSLTVPSGDYKVGVFGNSALTWLSQPSGYIPQAPSGVTDIPPPTGALPPPPGPPPPPGGVPPWDPWGDPGGIPWDDPLRPEFTNGEGPIVVEGDKIIFDPSFDILHDGMRVGVSPSNLGSYLPYPSDGGTGGKSFSQVPGQTNYGINLADIASMVNIVAYPGWTTVFAIVTAGNNPGENSGDLHCFVREFPINDGSKYTYPGEYDWNLAEISSLGGDDVQVIAIANLYNPGDDAKIFRVTLSDEGTAGDIYVMGFLTRARASLLQNYMGA
jgi:hypothetical protein